MVTIGRKYLPPVEVICTVQVPDVLIAAIVPDPRVQSCELNVGVSPLASVTENFTGFVEIVGFVPAFAGEMVEAPIDTVAASALRVVVTGVN